MKFLLFSVEDKALRDQHTVAHQRQLAYFTGHEADIVIFASGKAEVINSGHVRFYFTGGSSRFESFRRAISIIRSLRATRYNLVISQDVLFTGLTGWVVSRLRRVPLVVQLHGDYLDNPLWTNMSYENNIMNVVGKWVLRRAVGVRAVSSRIVKQVVDSLGVPASRVVSIPIGSDLSIFTPEGIKASADENILFVGRLIDEKSPMLFSEVACDVMKERKNLKAVILGDGNLREKMNEYFKTNGLGDRVTFTGNVGPNELASWYRSAYCLVHTAGWEGWGMPMIESLACGCPVVTTDTGCAGEAVIHEYNGFVTPVGDRKALSRATLTLLSDQALFKTLSKNAVASAGAWSFKSLRQKLISFYESCAKTI